MWLAWYAQQPDPGPGSIGQWVQFGALGLVIVALLTGWLWAKPAVDHIRDENRKLREEQAKQLEALIGEVHALRGDVREMRDSFDSGQRRERR